MLGEVFVSYKEWKNCDGFLIKEWTDKTGYLHRIDGPAKIYNYPCGSIFTEIYRIHGENHRKNGPYYIIYSKEGLVRHCEFSINNRTLGINKYGFWALWEKLNNSERQHTNILKYMVMFS